MLTVLKNHPLRRVSPEGGCESRASRRFGRALGAASVVLFLAPAFGLAPAGAAPRPDIVEGALPPGARVAVVAHNSPGGDAADRVVGDTLTTALQRAGVRVVERQDLDSILREQGLVRDGVVDPETAVETGRLLGATYLLDVRATEFGIRDQQYGGGDRFGPLLGISVRTSTARVTLEARVLNAQTGEVAAAETGSGSVTNYGGTFAGHVQDSRRDRWDRDDRWYHGERYDREGGYYRDDRRRDGNVEVIDIQSHEWSSSMIGRATDKAVDNLVRKLVGTLNTGEGSVLAVMPDGVTIVSLGGFDHLKVGDMLQLMHTEQVQDSKGAVVWNEEQPAGLLKVVEIRGDRAKAMPVDDSDSPREGDIVRLARR